MQIAPEILLIRSAMRKFALALALAPAFGHAALVVDGSQQRDASSATSAAPASAADAPALIIPAGPKAAIVAAPVTVAPPIIGGGNGKLGRPGAVGPGEASVALGPGEVVVQDAYQYQLQAGRSLQTQLEEWAAHAGWSIDWNAPVSWIVPGGQAFGTDFVAAAKEVFDALITNGADIRVNMYKGNKAITVFQTGAGE